MFINRQKFLAELGKLLTFMYEEDRQLALAMYNRLFDECTNEQGLIQMLVSPTRQAVLVARAYDAKERKLQVSSQAREENGENGGVPAFVAVIDKLFATAQEKGLFNTAGEAAEEKPAEAENEDQMSFFDFAESTDESVPLQPEPEQPESAEEQETAADEQPEAEEPENANETDALPGDGFAEDAAHEETADEEVHNVAAEEAAPAPAAEDEVDAFINSFSIDDNAQESQPQPEEEIPVYAVEEVAEDAPAKKRKVKKVMAGWLFLFVIFAIPIGIAGIVVLCVPTLLSLLISGGFAALGVLAVNAVLSSGFIVLADIMLILGAALILFALGLLFLWLFVWFIGGAMVGLVQGLINLGGKWCYKEVAVNE